MKRINTYIIIGLLTLTFCSCKIGRKENKPDMEVTLTEDKESGFKRLSFDSKSIEENGIITDIKHVLNRLNKEGLIKKKQLLFHIDGTYGHIFITGYNSETEYVFNNDIIKIKFPEYWEVVDNAVEFDNIISSSIKKVLNSDIGKTTKKNFVVYYQTEINNVKKIK